MYQSRLRPNALVILDDIHLNDMESFWDALPYPKLDISSDCHYSGFGLVGYADH